MNSLRFTTVKTLAELVKQLPDTITVSDHTDGPSILGPTLVVTLRGSREALEDYAITNGITEPILD